MISDNKLDGAVALVTGGSRGIGRAICRALAARGAKIIINYRSRQDAAEETAALCQEVGGTSLLAQFDVADVDAVNEGMAAAIKEAGGLHILVNNAGIAVNGLAMRLGPNDWQRLLNVNLGGVLACTKAASRKLLRAKERGRVINLSSVVGEMGNPGQSAYAATKAGVIGYTKSLAKEFASRQITVNAVAPGFIATEMTDAELPDDQRAALIQGIPLARIGSADDVADTVAFLAGPEAAYITGQVIRVNGGLLM